METVDEKKLAFLLRDASIDEKKVQYFKGLMGEDAETIFAKFLAISRSGEPLSEALGMNPSDVDKIIEAVKTVLGVYWVRRITEEADRLPLDEMGLGLEPPPKKREESEK